MEGEEASGGGGKEAMGPKDGDWREGVGSDSEVSALDGILTHSSPSGGPWGSHVLSQCWLRLIRLGRG